MHLVPGYPVVNKVMSINIYFISTTWEETYYIPQNTGFYTEICLTQLGPTQYGIQANHIIYLEILSYNSEVSIDLNLTLHDCNMVIVLSVGWLHNYVIEIGLLTRCHHKCNYPIKNQPKCEQSAVILN